MIGFGETVVPGFRFAFEASLLHAEQTSFQRLEVFDHASFGRMLVLDGLTQTTERDEFCYHEMLVHVPLICVPRPRRVLIIGGGDGGTLRHVLMHPSVERATMVEIDRRVTDVCRELMPSLGGDAFDDPRAEVIFGDGADYVRRTEEKFDAILIDSSDPVGPGVVLFTEEFYGAVRAHLAPGGVFGAQSGSPVCQQAELRRTVHAARSAFADARLYTGIVPTYPGALWSYVLGGESLTVDAELASKRAVERALVPRYWSPEMHAASFALPAFVHQVLAAGTPPGTFTSGSEHGTSVPLG